MPVLLALLHGHVLRVLQVASRSTRLQEAVAEVALTAAPVLISPGARTPIPLQEALIRLQEVAVAVVAVRALTVAAAVAEVVAVAAEAVAEVVDDVGVFLVSLRK